MIRVTKDWYERTVVDDWTGHSTARNIPTCKDIDEFCKSFHQDIIRQVTKGQGLYFGYECERFVDNHIPTPNVETRMSVERKYQQTKLWYKKQKLNEAIKIINDAIGFEETKNIIQSIRHKVSWLSQT